MINFYSKASNLKQLQPQDLGATEKVLDVVKEINRTNGPLLDSINKVLKVELPLLLEEVTKQFKEEQEAQLKRKFNNLLENALVHDLKRLHRILDLVEVNNYHSSDQQIWYNKNKIEELYRDLNEEDD